MSADPTSDWLLYGAYGYTGELIAREAVRRGLNPILGGRDRFRTEKLARELGLQSRVFSLDSASEIEKAIRDVKLLLHCAGPFSITSEPMVKACLSTKTHYLDITGEISVFESILGDESRCKEAEEKGVLLLPGTGFDVVPTDCLALKLSKQIENPSTLILAISPQGGPSAGTAKSMAEGFHLGGRVRKAGHITRVPLGYRTREIPFKHKPLTCVTIPWGDISTAFHTTHIPNIETYLAMPKSEIKFLKFARLAQPLFGFKLVREFAKKMIGSRVKGPSSSARSKTVSYVWGRVENEKGQFAEAGMVTPNGYDITVTASLGIVEKIKQDGWIATGSTTPAQLMGYTYVYGLPGVSEAG